MKLIAIKSMHPTNEFAPSWNIPMHLSQWEDYQSIDKIKNFLISKEPTLIGEAPKLLISRPTSRDSVFEYAEELPAIDTLLTFLRISYIYFIHNSHCELRDSWITSWYNIVHKGQSISEHLHDTGASSHISANMHLDNYKTTTDYIIPFDKENISPFPNQKGNLIMFPSYLPHRVNEHTEDNLRVSLAFDITLEKPNQHTSIKFMDNDILSSLDVVRPNIQERE
tara:strand:- start:710 stop:1381 length:672 start_codon:yes stop_codon:yes gene_type:complete